MTKKLATLLLLFATSIALCFAQAPRIVNIVNFVRQNDYRIQDSEALLLDATKQELALISKYDLPTTYLLQYDALIDSHYQELFSKKQKNVELGAWWEITKPQVEAAGLVWRGNHPWVSTANIAFTTGYTQAERKKLVDVYMAKFKQTFGYYPKSVGSWYIDAWTLNYMHERYNIVASCNCKDQIGTDGYTLWGGYWNQAYYPSKVNGYMPAQTEQGQIRVPVFRMLGSDPIYQYDSGLGGNGQGVISLEPVYPESGGNRVWTERFLDAITNQPCLSFGYTQAGQENSFTWKEIQKGLEMQIPILNELHREGKIKIMTLGDAGRWFKKKFKTTPATAVTALTDTQDKGNKTVWYNSRFYRCNIMIDKDGALRFRDIHLFDETLKSSYHETPGTSSHFVFETLPVVDGFKWSNSNKLAGLRIVKITDGEDVELKFSSFKVSEKDKQRLSITTRDQFGTDYEIIFNPEGISITSNDNTDLWALELTSATHDLPFIQTSPQYIKARHFNHDYVIRAKQGFFQDKISTRQYEWRVRPQQGTLAIDCTNPKIED